MTSPVNGSSVSSPFNLTMRADYCSSQPVIYVGYSLDNSTSTAIFAGQQMNGPVSTSAGWHVLHVKVWGNLGAVCVTDVSMGVSSGAPIGVPSAASSVIPSYAVEISNIQARGNWIQIHDGGTPGSSWGWTGTQSSPSLTGWAREFYSTFTYYGGQRYTAQFDSDNTSTNFFYDVWVYIYGSSAGFSNLEFDVDQTMQNGQSAVMRFQCDSWNNTWDFAHNRTGSPYSYNDTWAHSNQYCNVHNWTPNTWHHVQIWYARNSTGWVTYHSVWLDGVQQNINATAYSGYALGWGPAIVTNFQIDGASSGTSSAQVYLDAMTVYRW